MNQIQQKQHSRRLWAVGGRLLGRRRCLLVFLAAVTQRRMAVYRSIVIGCLIVAEVAAIDRAASTIRQRRIGAGRGRPFAGGTTSAGHHFRVIVQRGRRRRHRIAHYGRLAEGWCLYFAAMGSFRLHYMCHSIKTAEAAGLMKNFL